MKDFELVAHTADLKIQVYGTTLDELFVHALQGMFQSVQPIAPLCIKKDERLVCARFDKQHTITLKSDTLESLLVDFLSEALSYSDMYNEAYFDAKVAITNSYCITATIFGVTIQGFEVVEIKAVTYHDLSVTQTSAGWQAQIVFDI